MVLSQTWQHCKCSSEQLNCTQFDLLIHRKIAKIVRSRYHILRLKCTKFNFSAPDPTGGAYSAPPDPSAGFQGSPFNWRDEKGRKGREKGNKSPEWLSQKLGSTANAAVNS